MRIFVTGASGWIGSAATAELLANGHEVLGLARSDASAESIAAAGAEVVRGDIDDQDVLREGARRSDGVLHLAYRHDIAFTGGMETAIASDRAAIEALGEVLAGSDRPLAIASGVAGLAVPSSGEPVTERIAPAAGGRADNERAALAFADRGVRSMSLRFAPTVHGEGDHGFTRMVVDADRTHGAAAYVGDGSNRWAAVHRSDAGRVAARAIERAPAGSVLHVVGEGGVALRDVAEAIGRGLGIATESVSPEQATERFGFLGGILAMDMLISNDLTRELLDWTPTGPGLVQDIEQGHYFGTTG